MKHRFPKTNDDETITCPACQALNKTHAEFCRECGYAFGFTTLDPIETIRSEGSFLRKTVERPSKMALAVAWIIHLPLFILCIYIAIYFVLNRSELGTFLPLSSFGQPSDAPTSLAPFCIELQETTREHRKKVEAAT